MLLVSLSLSVPFGPSLLSPFLGLGGDIRDAVSRVEVHSIVVSSPLLGVFTGLSNRRRTRIPLAQHGPSDDHVPGERP